LLARKETKVRVLTRDASKAPALFGPDVEVAVGDIDTLEGVETALKGIDRLFLLTLSKPNQAATEKKVAQFAKIAGVKQIVKLSVFGASPADPTNSLIRWHFDSEQSVIESGVPYTILRPNLFLQNFLRDDTQSIKTQGKFYRRTLQGAKISHVDVRDISDVAATILGQDISKHDGQTYFLTGPESLDYDQVAEKFSKVLGRKIEQVAIDDAALHASLTEAKMPLTVVHFIIKLFQFYSTNACSLVAGDTQFITGKPARSTEDFIRDHKSAFL